MKYILSVFSILFLVWGCKKDEFETGSGAKLEFSEDTVIFDTVFTAVGSATQILTVYNRNDKPINISSINLAAGAPSFFRLNVDGVPGKSFTNVEIGANDSIFVFAEVTIDPNSDLSPFIATDSILFVTNGNVQDVDLVAWGRNCYFHRPPKNSPNGSLFFIDTVFQNINWPNDKPHVVYGYGMVDSSQVLTINEGTQVHFHPGSGLIVLSSGQLLVNGTPNNKVVFQGDRLGYQFRDVPGQWDRIWLSNASLRSNAISPGVKPSSIKWAIIKNGSIGLQVDTVFSPGSTTLTLENSEVKNMTGYALLLQGSKVKAYNSFFANTSSYTGALLYGGDYSFYHCTFANYWNNGNRNDPALVFNNYTGSIIRPLTAYFGNCIIYGNNDQEFAIDSFPANGHLNFTFRNCLMKVENAFSTSSFRYQSVIRAVGGSNSPGFADPSDNNYRLDSLNSSAIDAGDPAVLLVDPVLNFDLDGRTRPQRNAPDLGAYERE